MNWEAIGAVGEVVGAIGVIVTLLFLVIQLRRNTKVMQESNIIERAVALDRHTDSVSRWRTVIAENEELATIWLKALTDEELNDVEGIRLNNLWINFLNTQRSNFERALMVGEKGLATQATKSVAAEIVGSQILKKLWERASPWHALASPEFVKWVEVEMEQRSDRFDVYKSGSWLNLVREVNETEEE